MLKILCEAANAAANEQIIAERDMSEIIYRRGKVTTDDENAHNDASPDAYRLVRGKLIAALRG